MGKKWTYEEDQKLIELHKQYGKQWGVIAQHIKTRTASQVAARWEKCLDPALTKGPFTQEEDQLILIMLNKMVLKIGQVYVNF